MITLITGAPGAGKSAALVDLLREIAAKGRAIYVDGIPDLQVPHVELDDAKRWPELVPDGAAVVIDEVQRVWRPAGPGAKVSDDVQALETHRHRGLDFFIVTQHPNLVHQNVRRLVGRHVHLRDVGLLGRWWYEWPEATDPAQFRSAPVKKRYVLPKEAFALYKSASMHIKPIRSIPRSVVVLGLAVLSLAGLSWKAYSSIQSKLHPEKPSESILALKAREKPAEPARAAQPTTAGPMAAVSASQASSAPEASPVVGCISAKDYCRCFDRAGFPVVVEWDLCKRSAVGYTGLVPLDLTPSKAVAPAIAGSAPVGRPEVLAGSYGFDAGDFRKRVSR